MAKVQPTIIKVGSKGAYVNLNNTVSIGIVRGQTHNVLREDFEGEPKDAKPSDFVQIKADTLSFYFIARDELNLRAGYEITQRDFDQVAQLIEEGLVYKMIDDRAPVPN